MKKQYEALELELLKFSIYDVINSSVVGDEFTDEEGRTDDDSYEAN